MEVEESVCCIEILGQPQKEPSGKHQFYKRIYHDSFMELDGMSGLSVSAKYALIKLWFLSSRMDSNPIYLTPDMLHSLFYVRKRTEHTTSTPRACHEHALPLALRQLASKSLISITWKILLYKEIVNRKKKIIYIPAQKEGRLYNASRIYSSSLGAEPADQDTMGKDDAQANDAQREVVAMEQVAITQDLAFSPSQGLLEKLWQLYPKRPGDNSKVKGLELIKTIGSEERWKAFVTDVNLLIEKVEKDPGQVKYVKYFERFIKSWLECN